MEVMLGLGVAFVLFFVIPMAVLAKRDWKRLSILPTRPTDAGRKTPSTDAFGNIEPPSHDGPGLP